MKRFSFLTLALLAAIVLSACGAAAPLSSPAQRAEPEVGFVESEEMGVPAEAPAADRAAESQALARESVSDRLIIRDANLTLVVEDPQESVNAIRSMAERMGGFVVSSNVSQTTYGDSRLAEPLRAQRGNITVRVPSEMLDEALNEIKADAVEVRSENVSGRDVTEEFTDLESRLRNLEAAEEQLVELFERADDTEAVLQVLQELRRVREEIELVRGRMQYLEQSARLSSISVELIPDVAAQPLRIGRWTPQGTAREAVEALIGTLQFIADAAIWTVICVLPIALLLGLPGYFVGRAILRRRRAESGANATEEGAETDAAGNGS